MPFTCALFNFPASTGPLEGFHLFSFTANMLSLLKGFNLHARFLSIKELISNAKNLLALRGRVCYLSIKIVHPIGLSPVNPWLGDMRKHDNCENIIWLTSPGCAYIQKYDSSQKLIISNFTFCYATYLSQRLRLCIQCLYTFHNGIKCIHCQAPWESVSIYFRVFSYITWCGSSFVWPNLS